MKIKKIEAFEVLDSRGNPTIEVEIILENGLFAKALVPSGASTGEKEAVELRDGDLKRYKGKGVLKAVENVNKIISPNIINMLVTEQKTIDYKMIEIDGTSNKSFLGANAILGVSMAVARAAALSLNIPLFEYIGGKDSNLLPVPCMNIINGGIHSDNNIDFQEFMIAPHNATSFNESIRMGIETFHTLKDILKKKNYSTGIGDEGGFAPNLKSNEEAVKIIIDAIVEAGYEPGKDISLCLDPAVSEMWNNGFYVNFKSDKSKKTSEEMVNHWIDWVNKYPIILLEDGMAENDWDGWKILTEKLGNKIEIVGDDIFCTNPHILTEGIKQNIANSILIKLNQIGTVTETLETVNLAKQHNYNCFISHRSGETEDTFIADLTVAVNSGHLKTGSGCRGERIAKFNRLLKIEKILGNKAIFAGIKAFKNS